MAEAGAPLVMASRCDCQRSWPALLPLRVRVRPAVRFRLCLSLPIWDEVPTSGFGSGCEALLVGVVRRWLRFVASRRLLSFGVIR